MLNIDNHIEYMFYTLLKGFVKNRENGNIVVCNDCLEHDTRLSNIAYGYGDVEDKDYEIWNKITYHSECDCCNTKKEVVFLPIYIMDQSFRSMFTDFAYKDFKQAITLVKKEETLRYLKEYKQLLDAAGKNEHEEYGYLTYTVPIVRFNGKSDKIFNYQMIGVSIELLQRYKEIGFNIKDTNTSSVLSSVLNALVSSFCIQYDKERKNNSFEYFLKKIIEIQPFNILNSQYVKAEAKAIFDKLHYQVDADEIDFLKFVDLSLIEKAEHYFDEAYYNEDRDEDRDEEYADKLFEYLQEGPEKEGIMDTYGLVISNNWIVDAEVSFDEVSLKGFIDLQEDDNAWLQIKWLAEATANVTTLAI